MSETLGEASDKYTPQQTKNISELAEVSTDLVLYDGEGIDEGGKEFKYKYIELNGEKYRVPAAVLGQIKDLRESNKNLKRFRVKKTGTGLQTRYTTIPLA